MKGRLVNFVFAFCVAVSCVGLCSACGGKTVDEPFDWGAVATDLFAVPALEQGFVPQGLGYDDAEGLYFISGYMDDGSASRIYVIDAETGAFKYFTVECEQSSIVCGHFGGVAVAENCVFVATDGCVVVLGLANAYAVENGGAVAVVDVVETVTNADFCCVDNGGLWVGEFYYPAVYETDITHGFKISDEEQNRAIAVFYPFDESLPTALAMKPTKAMSLPSQVQGMSVLGDGRVIISASRGVFQNSKANIYVNSCFLEETIVINGEELPLRVLCNDNMQKSIIAPCMMEGIVCKDNKLVALFESGANKYKFLARQITKNVQSVPLD